MTTYHIAIDTNGQAFTRSSTNRTYTHCVVVRYRFDLANTLWPRKAGDVSFVTWCGRADLAEKAKSANTNESRTASILKAEVVDRKAYDATRKEKP